MPTPRSSARRRLAWSAALAAGTVLGAALVVPSSASDDGAGDAVTDRSAGTGSLAERYDAGVRAAAEAAGLRRHAEETGVGDDDGHGHDHSDPTTKNAV